MATHVYKSSGQRVDITSDIQEAIQSLRNLIGFLSAKEHDLVSLDDVIVSLEAEARDLRDTRQSATERAFEM